MNKPFLDMSKINLGHTSSPMRAISDLCLRPPASVVMFDAVDTEAKGTKNQVCAHVDDGVLRSGLDSIGIAVRYESVFAFEFERGHTAACRGGCLRTTLKTLTTRRTKR